MTKKRGRPKHVFTQAEHRAGGAAHAAIMKKRKGRAVTALAIRYAGLAGLEDLKWRPALQTLARVTLLVDRTYSVLKERETLIGKDGDLCRSIDVFRRLAETQPVLLKSVGLIPGAPMPTLPDGEIEAAYQRIDALKRVNTRDEQQQESESP